MGIWSADPDRHRYAGILHSWFFVALGVIMLTPFYSEYLKAQGVIIYPPQRTRSAPIDRRIPEVKTVKTIQYER